MKRLSNDNIWIQTYNWKYLNFSTNTRLFIQIKNLQLHWTRQHELRRERKRLKNENKIKRSQNESMKQTNIIYYRRLINHLLTWNAAQCGLLPVKEACNLKEWEVLAAIKRSPPNFRVKRKTSYKNPISKFKIWHFLMQCASFLDTICQINTKAAGTVELDDCSAREDTLGTI